MTKIKGPILTKMQIDVINEFKQTEQEILNNIAILKEQEDIPINLIWIEESEKELQKAFMCLIKGVSNNGRKI